MNRSQSISLFRIISLIGVYGGLLMPLVFIPVVIFPFVFSKLIAFQILIGLTFPAYLALIWLEPEMRPKKHWLLIAVFAYFVALALSVVTAIDPSRAWWGNQERMNGLFTLLHFLAWLLMATSLLKTWKQWKYLLQFEVVLSVIMALVALYQKIDPKILLFPAGDRVGGLLDNPIYQAVYQMFNLFFLALLFMRTSDRRARIWYVVLALIDLWAFFAAQSRGELIGLFVGIALFTLCVAATTKIRKIRYGVFGFAAACVLAYGTLFALRNTSIVQVNSDRLGQLNFFNLAKA